MKTRAHIRLSALAHNLQQVRSAAPGCRVMAMVKADAYGHGVTGILPALQSHSDGLAVARIDEAREIREAGYTGRVLLLAGVSDNIELAAALLYNLDIVVHDPSHLALLANYHYAHQHATHLWLKLDSGMHRLGFSPSELPQALQQLRALPWCASVTGMTHFASADETGNDKTARQIDCYRQHALHLPLDDHSLANSAGLLAWPASRIGWVRPGLMMYGVNPFADTHTLAINLQPAMTLEAQIMAVRDLPAGETIGYNERWRAQRPSRIAYVAAGYADGYPVTVNNNACVAVNHCRMPVVGRVSMDTIAIDCTDAVSAGRYTPTVGDHVELWGQQISVREVASWAGTIPYQLLTDLSLRVQRNYL